MAGAAPQIIGWRGVNPPRRSRSSTSERGVDPPVAAAPQIMGSRGVDPPQATAAAGGGEPPRTYPRTSPKAHLPVVENSGL